MPSSGRGSWTEDVLSRGRATFVLCLRGVPRALRSRGGEACMRAGGRGAAGVRATAGPTPKAAVSPGGLVREQRQDALGSQLVSGRVCAVSRRARRVGGGNKLSERFLREMHRSGACGETGECSVELQVGCCVTPTAICSVGVPAGTDFPCIAVSCREQPCACPGT